MFTINNSKHGRHLHVKRCQCGECDGIEFEARTSNQKIHPDHRMAYHRIRKYAWRDEHPDKVKEADRKYRQSIKGRLTLKNPKTEIDKGMWRLYNEGRVSEFIPASIAWKNHYNDILILHERSLLKPDEFCSKRSRTKEIDIYNLTYNFGYDVISYYAYRNDTISQRKRNKIRPRTHHERYRLADVYGIPLINLPFGKYQETGDYERQNLIAKVTGIMADSVYAKTGHTISGEKPLLSEHNIFNIEGVQHPESLYKTRDDDSPRIVPPIVCQARNTSVLHPNGYIYVHLSGSAKCDLNIMQTNNCILVNDLTPYCEARNIDILKRSPKHFITEDEQVYMDSILERITHVYDSSELALSLFTTNTTLVNKSLPGYIIKLVA